MTIQNIIDAMCDALFSKYGSAKKIYVEQVSQSLTEPCFFIKCLNPSRNVDLGIRYLSAMQYSVQYFPAVKGSYTECAGVLEDLYEVFEDLTVPITSGQTTKNYKLHGQDMEGKFTNEILTFTVNFNVFLLKETSTVDMGDLEVNVGSN